MSEHQKFPLPPQEEGDDAPGGSLIERAVKSFDWGKFAPPPVPDQLAPSARKPRSKPMRFELDPVVPEPAPAPVADPAPVAAPAPVVAAPQPAPSAELVVFPKRDKGRKAAVFSGTQHKINRKHLRDQGLIVPEGSVTGLLEEFRIIKRQLLLQAAELRSQPGAGGAAQRILICSPLPGEGKTYCSVNLALSMAAEKESEVLLVDADFAKPSVLSRIGMPGGPGLMDALADPSLDVADLVLGTDIPGLWVLPAGNATNSDSEYLNSARTASVLDRLTDGAPHRIIIFDSPPALAASPAAELAKYVGQAVLVARADSSSEGSLKDSASLLSACPNIQLLLNAANFSPSGRRFGTYYGYRGQ
jgi:Mrp family chromosome partitioning ATPase